MLSWCVQLPAAGSALLLLAGCGGNNAETTKTSCANPEEMSPSDKGLRISLQYTEASPDPTKVCGGCSFFESVPHNTTCGTCQLLHGAVNAKGRCASWNAKV